VDIDAQAARDSTASDIWWIGVRRLVVANGPNIYQMLLVLKVTSMIVIADDDDEEIWRINWNSR